MRYLKHLEKHGKLPSLDHIDRVCRKLFFVLTDNERFSTFLNVKIFFSKSSLNLLERIGGGHRGGRAQLG